MNSRSPEQMCDAKWLPSQLHHLDLYELFHLSNTCKIGCLCFSGLKIFPRHWIWNLLVLMQGWFQYMEALYNPESSGVKKKKKVCRNKVQCILRIACDRNWVAQAFHNEKIGIYKIISLQRKMDHVYVCVTASNIGLRSSGSKPISTQILY